MATNTHLLNCPPLRFQEFDEPWTQTTLGKILDFFPTNSLSWDQLNYSTGTIYNVHYGLIHKGLPIKCSPISSKLPYITEELESGKFTFCKSGDLVIADASEDTHDVGKAIELVECDKVKVLAGLHTIHARSSLDKIAIGFKGYLFASNNLREQLKRVAQGTKVYSISSKLISPLNISLPSLEEQKKIAEFLSLIDERIETQRQVIEERKNQKKALLHQIFSQSLRFPQFSDDWQPTTLGEVCTIKTGKLDANAMVEDGAYPFFTCAKRTYQTDTYSFSGEAILIAGNGEVGLTKYYKGKFNAYQRTYVLQIPRKDVVLLFIRSFIDHALPKRIISFLNGSAMPYITFSTLGDMPVFLPSLEEQERIAELFTIFDERIEVEEALLKCYEIQKRYLLRQMFV